MIKMTSISDLKKGLIKVLKPVLENFLDNNLPITTNYLLDTKSIVNKIEFYPDENMVIIK